MDKKVIAQFESALLNVIAEVIKDRFFDDKNNLAFDSTMVIESQLYFIKPLQNVPAIYYVGENYIDVVEAGSWGNLVSPGCFESLLSPFRLYIDFESKTVNGVCEATDDVFSYSEEELLSAGVDLAKIVQVVRDAYASHISTEIDKNNDFDLIGSSPEEHAAAIISPDYPV